MRAYVMTSGAIFGLIVGAHVLRVIEEGPQLARDRVFLLITAAAAALCIWAIRVLRRTSHR